MPEEVKDEVKVEVNSLALVDTASETRAGRRSAAVPNLMCHTWGYSKINPEKYYCSVIVNPQGGSRVRV